MGGIRIKSSIQDSYRVTNSARNYEWYADEPVEDGGNDSAPKPGELLLSALASCKLITMKMYAQRKGWGVDGMDIELEVIGRGDKTIVRKRISFPEGLDEAQKGRLTEISGRCPIAKMVKDSIVYVIE